jgi:hypothetical protein
VIFATTDHRRAFFFDRSTRKPWGWVKKNLVRSNRNFGGVVGLESATGPLREIRESRWTGRVLYGPEMAVLGADPTII